MGKDINSRILEIAKECKSDGSRLTRADLAYELKDCGIKSDSPELTHAVWNAYVASGKSEMLRDAFTDNSGSRSLVESYEVAAQLNDGDAQAALEILGRDAQETGSALDKLDDRILFALSSKETEQLASLMSIVSGTSGVQGVKQQASEVFNRYSELVSSYDDARECVTGTVADFTTLRSDIEKTYKRHVMALIDIFGDSIKTIAPQLFDYDSIEWLDAHGMLKKAELQYSTINTRCASLLGEISESFKKSLTAAAEKTGRGEAGLVIACVEMFSHYADASTKTAAVKGDLLNLRNDIRKDATCIKGDMLRLAKIFKTLNDLHIPRARIFYKHADTVMGNELEKILSAIYSTPETKKLEAKRQELLDLCVEFERRVESEKNDIAYYANHVDECKTVMESMKGQYEEAQARKPAAPNFLVNALSFGSARTSYNRKLFTWKSVCGPIIDQYNLLREDIKLDTDEKAAQTELLKSDEVELEKVKGALKAVNTQIRDALGANPAARARLLPHIKDMVALLRVAKDILESKLDDRDLKAVSIEDAGALSIPASMEKAMDAFKSSVAALCDGNVLGAVDIADAEGAGGTSDGRDAGAGIASGDTAIQESTEELSVAELSQAETVLVGKLTDTFSAWTKYNALAEAERSNKAKYEKQLNRLKAQFAEDMKKLDNKAEALRDVMAKINLSEDSTQLKQGLRALADIGDDWTDDEWDRFIGGDKTLTI